MSDKSSKNPDAGQMQAFGELYDQIAACPWCESKSTRVISPFGGTVSEISMQCNDCKSTFGWMKWQGKLPGED
jgi:hypothetical protein